MSVDVSGLIELIDDYAIEKWTCVTVTFGQTARENAPKDTGALFSGVVWEGPGGGSGGLVSEVESTARSADGVDYGAIQNAGTGPIHGNPILAFEVGGELIFRPSTSGVPATNWWDDTVDAFGEIVGGCAG